MIGFILCGFLNVEGLASEAVQVKLIDGRTLEGNVDTRTDERYLWIGLKSDRIEFASRHAWDSVVRIERHGVTIERGELLSKARSGEAASEITASPWDDEPLPTSAETVAAMPMTLDAGYRAAIDRNTIDLRPRSLIVRGSLANWDADSRPDGLLVEVLALNQVGRPVPVRGSIELRLVIAVDDLGNGNRMALPPIFQSVEQKSILLESSDFIDGIALVRFPFAREEWFSDTGIAPIALLHGRLSVPSVGVFEATDDAVVLKECNPLRDQFHYYSGSRFLTPERSGW